MTADQGSAVVNGHKVANLGPLLQIVGRAKGPLPQPAILLSATVNQQWAEQDGELEEQSNF